MTGQPIKAKRKGSPRPNKGVRGESCKQGHFYSEVGWYETASGRKCRECNRIRTAENAAKRKRAARAFKLPASDPRAVAFRTEAALRGIELKLCA